MKPQTAKLLDPAGNVVATAQVTDEGAHYGGTIDLRETPPSLRALFEEFEENVSGQMFTFVDEVEEKIGGLRLKAVFDTGRGAYVKDLQVFPSTGDVSFKLAEVPSGNPA